MRILFWEVRRYLRPMTLAIIAVFTAFWLLLFTPYFPKSGRCDSVRYQQRFGDVIDTDEFEIIKQDYADLCVEIDELFEKHMGEYGVHSLDDFRLLQNANYYGAEDYQTAAERWGEENIEELYRKCSDIYWWGAIKNQAYEEQNISNVIETFEKLDKQVQALKANDPDWGFDEITDYQRELILEDCRRHELSILNSALWPDHTDFRERFQNYALLIYIISAFIAIPFLINNKITGTQTMQFASKRGKNILNNQLGVALAVSAIVNIIIDTFFYINYFYDEHEIHYLLSCPINVGAGGHQLWFNITYMQYVWLILVKTMLLSLALTCALFILSYFCKNHIAAMTIAAVSVLIIFMLSWQLDRCFYLTENPVWQFPILLLLPIAAVITATVVLMKKIRREDYLY